MIEVERGKLRGDFIRCVPDVSQAGLGRERELSLVVQAGIEERPFAVHLGVGHVRVPVRHAAPTGVGVKVHTRQTKRRWKNGRCRTPLRPGRLAILVQFSVVLAGPPAFQHFPDRRIIDSQQV